MDKLDKMDAFLQNVQSSKTESGRIRESEQTDYSSWIWSSSKKLPENKSPGMAGFPSIEK